MFIVQNENDIQLFRVIINDSILKGNEVNMTKTHTISDCILFNFHFEFIHELLNHRLSKETKTLSEGLYMIKHCFYSIARMNHTLSSQ